MITRVHRKVSARNGFTLIELLVVIAIIGLLIAILIPGLMLAQAAANQLICQTNLDQLFKGSLLHTEDDPDGRLPYYGWLQAKPSYYEWWVTEVATAMEVNEPEIFRCPMDPHPVEISLRLVNGNWHMPYVPLPGGGNNPVTVTLPVTYRGSCDHVDHENSNSLPRRITDFHRPSIELLLIEGPHFNNDTRECTRWDQLLGLKSPLSKYSRKGGFVRHSGTSNAVYLDGHVSRHTPAEFAAMVQNQPFLAFN